MSARSRPALVSGLLAPASESSGPVPCAEDRIGQPRRRAMPVLGRGAPGGAGAGHTVGPGVSMSGGPCVDSQVSESLPGRLCFGSASQIPKSTLLGGPDRGVHHKHPSHHRVDHTSISRAESLPGGSCRGDSDKQVAWNSPGGSPGCAHWQAFRVACASCTTCGSRLPTLRTGTPMPPRRRRAVAGVVAGSPREPCRPE